MFTVVKHLNTATTQIKDSGQCRIDVNLTQLQKYQLKFHVSVRVDVNLTQKQQPQIKIHDSARVVINRPNINNPN